MHNSLNQAFIRAYAKEREAVQTQAVNHAADRQAEVERTNEELILRIDTTNVEIARSHLSKPQPARQTVTANSAASTGVQKLPPLQPARTAEDELRASIASEMLRAGGWHSEQIASLAPIASDAAPEFALPPLPKPPVASAAEEDESHPRTFKAAMEMETEHQNTVGAKFFNREPAVPSTTPDFMQHVKAGSIVRLDQPPAAAYAEVARKPALETPVTPVDLQSDQFNKPQADQSLPQATAPVDPDLHRTAKTQATADVKEVEQALRRAKVRIFSPVWEVDQLQWPEVCVKLMEARMESLTHVTKHLTDACQDGLQVLAVTSPEGGEGRTTVACCLAMLAGSRGLKVAIVDGDIENPTLCLQTNLEIENDWQTAILNQLPLEEVSVHSIDDQITLVPLLAPLDQNELASSDQRIANMLLELAESFDLVILDIGHMSSPNGLMQTLSEQGIINAAIAVVDYRNASPLRIETCIRRIRQAGITSIGLVENFAA